MPLEFEFIAPEGYFGFVAVNLALFCAVAAPEIIGRDQRTRTLSLYFSRAMSRMDYALAKLAALFLSLWVVLLAPMVLLLVGDAVAADDLVDNVKSNVDLVPPIVGTSLVIAMVMGGMSLAIASMTSRRAYSTGSVLAYFVVFTVIGEVLLETLSGDSKGYALLISPVGVLEGAVYWIFNTTPPSGEHIEEANLDGVVYFAAACGYIAVALGFFLRRNQKLTV